MAYIKRLINFCFEKIINLNYGLITPGIIVLRNCYCFLKYISNKKQSKIIMINTINIPAHNETDVNLQINKEILTWTINTYKNQFDKNSYVVINTYYQNLYFVFDNLDTANDFCEYLKSFNEQYITNLANSGLKQNKFKSEFIKSRFAMNMMIGYTQLNK